MSAMAAALAHRGPDGERIVGHERARLGARRLAIMDLTTGDQPFQNPDGAIWMICNGEIYNAPELRRERSEEHTSELQSHSDLVCRLLLEKKKQISRVMQPLRPTSRTEHCSTRTA